jgi:thiamine phosphate synthase YjbQ (UPF0047 family)
MEHCQNTESRNDIKLLTQYEETLGVTGGKEATGCWESSVYYEHR